MDENLNAALNSLDMLATVTNSRREYLSERRFHNICTSLSCVPLWRAPNSGGAPTKENQALENAILCCGPRRLSEKFCSSRRSRSRGLPYDIRRKPFHNASSCSSSVISTRGRTHFGSTAVACSAHLVEQHELKSKTEKFPVPLLFRSKSLEDLRDASSSPTSQGLQLPSNINNLVDCGPGELNLCTMRNINIKTEIDSMSMRIEKLDVA